MNKRQVIRIFIILQTWNVLIEPANTLISDNLPDANYDIVIGNSILVSIYPL